MTDARIETGSLRTVKVPADELWGAQTQRSLEHFGIGPDLMPPEMMTAHHAPERDPILIRSALRLGVVDEATFDRVVDPVTMVKP
jgi:fumarate hydratase class II